MRAINHPLRKANRPSKASLLLLRVSNLRVFILRGIEILFFQGEIHKSISENWDIAFPIVRENLKKKTLVSEQEIIKYKNYSLIQPGGKVIIREDSAYRKPVFTYHLSNVNVETKSGVVWNERKWILGDTTPGGIGIETQTQWGGRSSSKYLGTKILLPSRPIFFHFLIEDLPSFLIGLEDVKNQEVEILVSSNAKPWILEFLKLASLDFTKVSKRSFQVSSFVTTTRNSWSPSSKELGVLRKRFQDSRIDLVPQKRIFISRRGFSRVDEQDNEVEKFFLGLEFLVIDPSKLRINEQIELFSSASIIVGFSGAAFSNLVWCRNLTSVLVLRKIGTEQDFLWNRLVDSDLTKIYGIDTEGYSNKELLKILEQSLSLIDM
jgi:hypothetical protein